ncbi:hypothetical protein CspHIS471_0702740 [Cutaneotrichosporon sp. HIS471]|nr:hypothetical protein CspHIS471_0702740 [Cutaneotrichosporon sp. HIS471]
MASAATTPTQCHHPNCRNTAVKFTGGVAVCSSHLIGLRLAGGLDGPHTDTLNWSSVGMKSDAEKAAIERKVVAAIAVAVIIEGSRAVHETKLTEVAAKAGTTPDGVAHRLSKIEKGLVRIVNESLD